MKGTGIGYESENIEPGDPNKINEHLRNFNVPEHYKEVFRSEFLEFGGISAHVQNYLDIFKMGGHYNPNGDYYDYEVRWNRFKDKWHQRFKNYLEHDIQEMPLIDKLALSSKPRVSHDMLT